MARLGEEPNLLVGYLAQSASYLSLGLVYIIIVCGKNNEQKHDEGGKPTDDFLAAVHLHIAVDVGINGVKTIGLARYLVVLHLHNGCVLGCNEARREVVHTLYGLVLEYAHGKRDERFAMRWIDVRGCETPFLDKVYALSLARQTVNAHKHDATLLAYSLGCLPCTERLGIVMAEDTLDVGVDSKAARHYLAGAVYVPVAINGGRGYARILAYLLHKAPMTLLYRGGAFQSGYLEHLALATQLGCNEAGNDTTYLYIVGSDVGCKAVGVDLTVVQYHWHTLLVSPFHSRRNGACVAWSDNKEVDTACHQAVYLPHLTLGVVVGRAKPHVNILVLVLTYLYLTIHLLPPCVVAALRDAYHGAAVGARSECQA